MNHRLRLAALALALLATPHLAQAAAPSLFGTVEYRNDSLDALPQWQSTLERIDNENPSYRACARDSRRCASPGLDRWQTMLRAQAGRTPIDQIQAVNGFVNQSAYRTDRNNYGKSDYWATPAEFFSRSGDCEDYAIAKYVSLRQLGFGAEQLRLVVVNDTVRHLAHAVLAVYVEGKVFILDNLSSQALPQERIASYAPYYSVNETARWAHAEPAAPVATAAASASPAAPVAVALFAKP